MTNVCWFICLFFSERRRAGQCIDLHMLNDWNSEVHGNTTPGFMEKVWCVILVVLKLQKCGKTIDHLLCSKHMRQGSLMPMRVIGN